MAITRTLTATTAQANASTTSLAINVPSGISNGDVMITVLQLNAAVTITQPGGWTNCGGGFPVTNGTNVLDAWYRVASSEPASYTWTFGSAKCNIGCIAYSGVSNATPVEVASAGTSSSPNAGTPTISVSGGDWIISCFSDRDASAGSTWTTPTGAVTLGVNLLNTGTSEGSLAVFDTGGSLTAGSYSYQSTSSTTQSTTATGAIGLLATATGSPRTTNIRQAVNRSASY